MKSPTVKYFHQVLTFLIYNLAAILFGTYRFMIRGHNHYIITFFIRFSAFNIKFHLT